MSEAIPRCPKLQGIATLESAFPFAHVLLLPTVENRLFYITIILPTLYGVYIIEGEPL
tara:strand:- start:432 stop:605 length:174 start_codon:yes stop_codon:yes gene_type:complete